MALWPTARVAAPLPLITVKADPEIDAWLMFTASVPVFVTLVLCTSVLPMATLPKESVVALAERMPVPGSVDPFDPVDAALVTPAQFVSVMAVSITARVASMLPSERRNGAFGWYWVPE